MTTATRSTRRVSPPPFFFAPDTAPVEVEVDEQPRCSGTHQGRRCEKLLAEYVTRPWSIKCPRCKSFNAVGTLIKMEVSAAG